MATTYTTYAKLSKPALADRNWDVPINANATALDAMAAIGALCVTMAEVPSASLNVAVAAGTFVDSTGAFVTYAGTASQAITTGTTKYLYLTDGGTLTVASAWPAATVAQVRLAVVVAGASTITSITDARIPWSAINTGTYLPLAGGTMGEAANVALGTTTGSKIGTSAAQKLGFWNATPVIQPASANQAAVGTLATVTLTDSTGGSATTTLGAGITDTVAKDAIASLALEHAHTLTDLTALKTLVNQLRADLVTAGILKGSA